MKRFSHVNQFLTSAVPGDAIYHQAVMLRDALRSWGYRADIFCESRHPTFTDGAARYYHLHRPQRDELILFHYSLASRITEYIQQLLTARPSATIVPIYHNITPVEFLRGLGNQLQRQTRAGREQLTYFRDKVPLVLADSAYNRQELLELGFPQVRVFPLALNEALYRQPPDAQVLQQFSDNYANLLFVGRVIPHKKQEDIIKCLYYYRRFNPQTRLFLVGSWASAERYYRWLQDFAARLNLAEDVCFCGHVSQEALIAYYQLAAAFVCMSEHEGFCVPLLESMYFRVPIIAYAAGAVPETLGNAGVLVKRKHYGIISAAIDLILTDEDLHRRLCDTQSERLQDFAAPKILAWFEELLQWLMSNRS